MTTYEKLLEVQKEVGAIKKGETNPYFNSKYFDINGLLEVVKPVLSKHGLLLLQPLMVKEGVNVLTTTILNAEDPANGVIASEVILPVNTDPQKMGSAISYYRRYALTSLLALAGEDDDGNVASDKIKTVKKVNNKVKANFNEESDIQALSEIIDANE